MRIKSRRKEGVPIQLDHIYTGDCLEVLKTLPDESVHCCITSPPYYALRDYGVDGQIGREATPKEYISRLTEVFAEVRRVLRSDGTLWLNISDTYAGKGNQGGYVDAKNPKGRNGQAVALNYKVKDCKPKDIYDGFDETAVNLLRQEVMPVEKMPDDSINIEEMKQYGYKWGGMLPMREEAAAEVMKSCQIYRLYGDDTEGLVLDAKEVPDHAAKGGIFGVEKSEWKAMLERQNPLKTAEMSVEDDYGMIDGIINNGSKEKESSEKREKSSIMDRLKAAKSSKPQVKSAPSKEKKSERDL